MYLVHCGYQQCKPNYTYNHKIPNEYHLHFVLSGTGTLSVNNITYSINKDDIFLIPKDYPIDYSADSQNPWEYMWVTFDGEQAAVYLEYAGFSESQHVISSAIPTAYYYPSIKEILDLNKLTYANEIKRVGLLYEILSTLIEAQNSTKISNSYDYSNKTYIEHALEFISANYNKITVSDVANYIGINRCYLSTIFKEELNLSPQEYLINFRLNKADEMLIQTNLSVKEIANKIGYENSSSFSKIFKKTYGESPTVYRLKHSS